MVVIDWQLMYTSIYNCSTNNGKLSIDWQLMYTTNYNCSTNNGNGVHRLTAHVQYYLQLFYQ